MRSSLSVAILITTLLLGCTDPTDKAAKKRIFSPEDPPKVVSSAAQKLSPAGAVDDPRLARRLLDMGAAEATERLGPHQYDAVVTFEWTSASATNTLSEKRLLLAGRGGVDGDFDARTQNSRDQGLEVLRVGGQVFAKELYGKFRQRLHDRGMAERTREDVHGTLRDFATLFDHRLKLSSEGETSYEGRTAHRFKVALAGSAEPDPPSVRLPPLQLPRAGMDEGTRKRNAFFGKRHIEQIAGELWADVETGVVLKAHLTGRLEVEGKGQGRTASLKMSLDQSLKHMGQATSLKAPTDFMPDEDKPSGIADALDRFGIPRGGHADAGTDLDVPDDEP